MSDQIEAKPETSSPDSQIEFEGYQLPGLKSGELQIQSSFTLKASGIPAFEPSAPQLNILVSGPRFVLSPAEIFAVFPPRDSFGEFDNTLPHIELTPSTLPWQRASGSWDVTLPWLALILLQDDEWTDSSKVTTETIAWEILRKSLGLTEEATDAPPDNQKPYPPVKVLQIEKNFLGKIMPTPADLSWLSHVRVGQDAARAVLVCNRMPRAGARAEVHLVSLERRLTPEGRFDDQKGEKDGKIALLSLYSWQFTCPADEQYKVSDKAINRLPPELQTKASTNFPSEENRYQLYRGRESFAAALKEKGFDDAEITTLVNLCRIQTETFKGLMDALSLGWLHLPLQENQEAFFTTGSIPLAHGLRKGGKTVSWYHGPLIPDRSFSAAAEETIRGILPVRSADQLLFYNRTTHMLDASYAAAWELGRLITVSEPRLSQQIAQWKTSRAREVALAEQNLFFSHIPFTDSRFVHQSEGLLEGKLQQYFTDLSLLKGVPFHYLIPHERLLPDEAMRFFYIDPLWIDCLLDGAFSIGRTTQYDRDGEKNRDGDPQTASRAPMTGVLLRSDLVSGWPALLVEGDGRDDPSKPTIRRCERLGPNVLMVIFEGEVQTVTVHLPPESLHFGFSRPIDVNGKYFKELKNINDGTELAVFVDLMWRFEDLRIFDSEILKDTVNSKIEEATKDIEDPIKHAGQFAIELLEGVPRLRVTLARSSNGT